MKSQSRREQMQEVNKSKRVKLVLALPPADDIHPLQSGFQAFKNWIIDQGLMFPEANALEYAKLYCDVPQ